MAWPHISPGRYQIRPRKKHVTDTPSKTIAKQLVATKVNCQVTQRLLYPTILRRILSLKMPVASVTLFKFPRHQRKRARHTAHCTGSQSGHAWVEHGRHQPGDADAKHKTLTGGFEPPLRHLIEIVVHLQMTSHNGKTRA